MPKGREAFFDVDYTLYNGYSASNFNLFMAVKEYAEPRVARAEALLKAEYKNGTIDYREASRRALQLTADSVAGHTVEEVGRWRDEFMAERDLLFTWVPELVALLKSQGFRITLVSAAPLPPIQEIAERIGADACYGTELEIAGGTYTGKVGRILHFEAKSALLTELLRDAASEVTLGFGDSVGDIEMLSLVDHAFLYEPKARELTDLAHERGWAVVSGETIIEEVRARLELVAK